MLRDRNLNRCLLLKRNRAWSNPAKVTDRDRLNVSSELSRSKRNLTGNLVAEAKKAKVSQRSQAGSNQSTRWPT